MRFAFIDWKSLCVITFERAVWGGIEDTYFGIIIIQFVAKHSIECAPNRQCDCALLNRYFRWAETKLVCWVFGWFCSWYFKLWSHLKKIYDLFFKSLLFYLDRKPPSQWGRCSAVKRWPCVSSSCRVKQHMHACRSLANWDSFSSEM